MIALIGGVTVSETGSGSNRNVQVRDLYSINDPAHPRRFMRLKVTSLSHEEPLAFFSACLNFNHAANR